MSYVLLEFALIVALLVVNGLLAMSELAVVTARRGRLARQAEAGDRRAAVALELAANPAQFLSTVQVGITLVGILAGAFGGATIAEQLAGLLAAVPAIGPYADGIAFTLVVAVITYLSSSSASWHPSGSLSPTPSVSRGSSAGRCACCRAREARWSAS